ncbi:MAG: hypothetical protein HUJ63_10240 [Enterococcus sp.]|nr:hypothetical protein [Enterococcus sp.]
MVLIENGAMNMSENGTHYPKVMVANALNESNYFDKSKAINANLPEFQDNKKSLTSFRNGYSYIFDGLCYLLSQRNFVNVKRPNYFDPNGQPVDVIERKDDDNEFFYKSVIPIDTFFKMCLGKKNMEQSRELLKQLYNFTESKNQVKNIYYFNDAGELIIDKTQPIRISFQYVTGLSLNASVLKKVMDAELEKPLQERMGQSDIEKTANKKIQHITNYRNNFGNAQNPIEFITIEYHKGLFKDLLKQNKNGFLGWNYYRATNHFTAKCRAAIKEFRDVAFFENYNNGELNKTKVPLFEYDVTQFYYFLLERNNDSSKKIEFSTLEYCKSCDGCSQYINRKTDLQGVIRESVPSSRGFELRVKIKKIIIVMKKLAIQGEMNGSILLPYELDENRVSYNTDKNTISIKVLYPSDRYLSYDVNQIPPL